MRRLLVIFLCLIGFGQVNAQDTNVVDDQGLKQGLWVTKYPDNTTLKEYGAYADDKKDGAWSTFHPNGLINLVEYYKDGELHGPTYAISKKGELLKMLQYVDGKPDGKHHYYFSGGRTKKIEHYENGLLEGLVKENNRSGAPKEEATYSKGQKDGIAKWYFAKEDCGVSNEYTYKMGQIHGPVRNYYCGGKLKSEVQYVDNQRQGDYREFFEEGPIKTEGQYKDGKKDGTWVYYQEDGSVEKKEKYKNGELR